MPFTPYHFGPSACLGLPLNRHIDIPVFVLANVVVDFEPLIVMLSAYDYPLHGLLHTFLIGAGVGIIWAFAAYPLRKIFRAAMKILYLPYETSLMKMIVSGILGVWLHVLLDSFLYDDIRPFWPMVVNPFYRKISYSSVHFICELLVISAVVIYPARAYLIYRRRNIEEAISTTQDKKQGNGQ